MRRTLLLVSIVTSTFAGLFLLIASLTAAPAAVAIDTLAAPQTQIASTDLASPSAAAVVEPMIVLRKNFGYYDAKNVAIPEITSLLIDQEQAWARYQAGEFDTIIPPASALPEIAELGYDPQLVDYAAASVNYVGFSLDKSPMDNSLLRAALATAIDRQRFINEVLTGKEEPALTLTPPGSFGHVDGYAAGIGHPYSPTLAAGLRDEAGYNGQVLSMTVDTGRRQAALSLQKMWLEAGFEVVINDYDTPSYWDLMINGTVAQRPHIFMIGWLADYPDANNFHNDIFVSGNNNWPRYSDEQYQSIVLNAAEELDPAKRAGLYQQAEALLVGSETAIAPVNYGVWHDLTRPDLNRSYRGYGAQHFEEWFFDAGAERSLYRADSGFPQTLDPARAALRSEIDYIGLLFRGLTDIDLRTREAVPELARSWEVSPDGLAYSFTLRSDVYWTDGSPVTAFDVQAGVLRSLDPIWGPDHYPGSLLYIIRNAALYQRGDQRPEIVGVQALSETLIRFDLEAPAAYFPLIAGLWPARPVPQQAIELYGDEWTRPDRVVTNGPYRLVAFNINDADVGVIKRDSADPVTVNERMTYTLEVYNNGPVSATDVFLQDTLPLGVELLGLLPRECSQDGDIYCNLGTIAPGDKKVVSFSVVPTVVGTIYNRALVTANEYDGNVGNDRAVEATQVVEALPTAPILRSILPRYGVNSQATPVIVSGLNFQQGIKLALIKDKTVIPLTINRVAAQQIDAVVPARLATGAYHLLARNPNGEEDLLPEAFIVVAPVNPELLAVRPSVVPNDRPGVIDVYGKNFAPGVELYLQAGRLQGAAPLANIQLQSVLYIDAGHLRAVVPKGTPADLYNLAAINPGGGSALLLEAVKVFDVAALEDLLAESSDLWLRPLTLQATQPVSMGLVVHRRSSLTADPLNVRVAFYDGDPARGGQPIGGSSAPVPPASHASTAPINWTPQEIGGRLLCAVIDPLDAIEEVDETNNKICREVRVLPKLADTKPPTVTSFTVNDGERWTTEPWVSLDMVAEDDTRVSRVLYAEYVLNLAGNWDLVAAEWLPYETSSVDYPWRLYPAPGIHYFRACVADPAGNVACAPGVRPIAYLPGSAYLVDGEVHVYRRLLEPGTYEVQLTILSGNMADLYVWDSEWQINGPVVVMSDVITYEAQQFTVVNARVHQLEVEATQGNVLYQLNVIPVASGLGQAASVMDPTSPVARFTPFVNPEDTPSEDESGLPSVPPEAELFLPMIMRE